MMVQQGVFHAASCAVPGCVRMEAFVRVDVLDEVANALLGHSRESRARIVDALDAAALAVGWARSGDRWACPVCMQSLGVRALELIEESYRG